MVRRFLFQQLVIPFIMLSSGAYKSKKVSALLWSANFILSAVEQPLSLVELVSRRRYLVLKSLLLALTRASLRILYISMFSSQLARCLRSTIRLLNELASQIFPVGLFVDIIQKIGIRSISFLIRRQCKDSFAGGGIASISLKALQSRKI